MSFRNDDWRGRGMQERLAVLTNGQHPASLPATSIENVPRGTLPAQDAGMGAWSLESAARAIGTDRKTLLLIGVLGIVGGYLLNDAIRATKLGARRVRRGVGKAATGRNLAILGGVVILGGAAYLYYRNRQQVAMQPRIVHPAGKAR